MSLTILSREKEITMPTPKTFGWVKSPPDSRDALYAFFSRVKASALPPKFRADDGLDVEPWHPVYSQGSIGSCGPHSLAANIVFGDFKDGDNKAVMPSRLFLYWTSRYLMGTVRQDSGVNNRAMLTAFARYGWCPESLWPYDVRKFTNDPPQSAFDAAKERLPNIVYRAVPQNLTQMKACLVETGRPFIFGFLYLDTDDTPTVERTGDLPDPQNNSVTLGGHDVLIVGYDDSRQRFIFRNSWGTQWGNGGYGTISYARATHPTFASDFWTVERATADVTPPPEPPKPDGGSMFSKILAFISALKAGDFKAILKAVIELLDTFNTVSAEEKAQVEAVFNSLATASPETLNALVKK